VGVPKIMKADAGQVGLGQNAHPFMRERSRLDGGTIILATTKLSAFGRMPRRNCSSACRAICLQLGYDGR
jgi:hypothetical protein